MTDISDMDEREAAANNRVGLLLQRAVTVVFLALGAFVAIKALDLPYYTRVGPGPAFVPFWLGIFLVVLSILVLLLSFRGRPQVFEERIIATAPAARQMIATFVMVAFFALTIQPLGFVFSIFGVLMVLQLVNRVAFLTALLVTIGGSLGVGYAFTNWLGVYVPPAPYGLLSALGL